jgi:Carboxyltransferase domain, subdomain A and B
MMATASEAILRVVSAGPGATLQDAGRHGYLRFGVTAAGPMDQLSHATANLAVGNPAGSTAIEVSVSGIEVTAEFAPLSVAVAGGEFTLSLDGRPLPPAVVFNLDEGAVLKIRAGRSGSWCYLAVAGRFVVAWTAARSPRAIVSASNGPDRRSRRWAPSWHPGSIAPLTPFGWCLVLSTTTSPTIRSPRFWLGPGPSPPSAIAWRIFSKDPS